MPKIIVTETFTRTYELEVDDLSEETVQEAIDGYNEAEGLEPQWVGTCATDEAGETVLDY